MHEPYVGGGCGSLCVGGDSDGERTAEITAMIRYAHAAGHQLAVPVTGDRAIDAVADAFAEAAAEHPRSDARHYVIHGDLLTAHSMKGIAPTRGPTRADRRGPCPGAGPGRARSRSVFSINGTATPAIRRSGDLKGWSSPGPGRCTARGGRSAGWGGRGACAR
ncbi:hypothetical protein ABT246_41080 [Streptomyces sp. NPDC001553]|uniref:hypothetical protein n=1 Tax=Streptomyces sp. NPDC001553 TaxID=3154385 RepID=UPI00332B450E